MNRLTYSCCCDIGRLRKENQDNYICDGNFLSPGESGSEIAPSQTVLTDRAALFGVFDGLGGEECGEVASLIAAKNASALNGQKCTESKLHEYCMRTNSEICRYVDDHGISSMGTTAAILAFTKSSVILCNIGDSKVFRLSKDKFEQLSEDHYCKTFFGKKPPLSQCLGIPETEIIIEPYIQTFDYENGDIFLICTDGLTDMVDNQTIQTIIRSGPFETAAKALMSTALYNGGKDNVTLVICKLNKSYFRIG